jgi:hypothetical protein
MNKRQNSLPNYDNTTVKEKIMDASLCDSNTKVEVSVVPKNYEISKVTKRMFHYLQKLHYMEQPFQPIVGS